MATIALTLVAVAPLSVPAPRAQAAVGSDFDPGYIISDERFFDNGSMTEAQIQAFLVAQMPNCRSTDASLPCLRNLVTSTWTRSSTGAGSCDGYVSEGGWESAAHIIWKVAQSCRISPQVLLVTLQKEQGLVTASQPSASQYRSATGYGCPDTAPCDAAYYGFYNQVYMSAWQFRQYTITATHWRYQIGANQIQYHPSTACGWNWVNIRNQATADLYIYTPYQPDAAALANLYGTGDNCSSYGNRNFWRIFSDWFGSPTASGTTAIDTLYASLGGASGSLGPSVSDYIPISTTTGAGTGRAYANGSIYWTARTGAAAVVEPYRALYFSMGGALGPLSWPNSQSAPIGSKPGGGGQSYVLGSIYTSTATGTHSVLDPLRDPYFRTGGALGVLGWPTAERQSITSGGASPVAGYLQSFEGGAVAWNSASGGQAILAPVLAAYTAAGGPAGTLGWPASAPLTYTSNGGGTAQVFDGGSVYSSSAGAFPVSSRIRDGYFAVGGSNGWLGWPIGAMTCSSGTCRQQFQRAWIVAEDGAVPRVSVPAIDALYQAQGGASGPLGARLSDVVPVSDSGTGQVFAGGSVYASAAGAFAVTGGIRAAYWGANAADGMLGFPTAAAVCQSDGSCSQTFAGGTITWSPSAGARIGRPAIDAVYAASGGASGPLGARVSGVVVIPQNGGGWGQVFQGGSIYESVVGAFAVSGGIRDAYFARGGSAGPLGWPTAAAVCTSGTCVQQFQSGSIRWSVSGGAVVS